MTRSFAKPLKIPLSSQACASRLLLPWRLEQHCCCTASSVSKASSECCTSCHSSPLAWRLHGCSSFYICRISASSQKSLTLWDGTEFSFSVILAQRLVQSLP